MNTCYELVQVQPLPQPARTSPPALLEWGAVILMLLGAGGFFGRWFLEQWGKKEDHESTLMAGLVTFTQNLNSQLIADSKENKQELIRAIDLKNDVNTLTITVKDDLQRALSGQTSMYGQGLENQALMKNSLERIHERLDEQNAIFGKILEGLK